MKTKIKIKNFDGQVVEKSGDTRALDHLEAQQKYRSSTFKDKTKYNRKVKHKNKNWEI